MLGTNELCLREVSGKAANFNRANRRGFAAGAAKSPKDFLGTPPIKMLGTNELCLRDVACGNINRRDCGGAASPRWKCPYPRCFSLSPDAVSFSSFSFSMRLAFVSPAPG